MKLIITTVIVFLHLVAALAQDIKVDAVNRTMSQGEQPGFSVVLPKADVKAVETSWAATVQGKNKTKPVKENNEWVMRNALLPSITQDTLTVYARTISTTEGVVFEAFFYNGKGFIGTDNSLIHPQAQKFVYDFAIKQHKNTIKTQIDAAEDVLKSLNKEYSTMSKELEKLNGSITKSKMAIDDNKNKISTNEADQNLVRERIQAQKKKIVDAANLSAEAKKVEEKNLKTLDKELAALLKAKEKLLQANVKQETTIRDAELGIKNKEVAIDAKQKQISEQNGKIKALKDQLQSYK